MMVVDDLLREREWNSMIFFIAELKPETEISSTVSTKIHDNETISVFKTSPFLKPFLQTWC